MPSGRDRPLSNTDPPSCNSSALTSRRAFALLVPEPTFSERSLQWLLFATRHFCRFGPFLTSTAPSAGGITPFLQNCRLTVMIYRLYSDSHTTSQDLLFSFWPRFFRKVTYFAKTFQFQPNNSIYQPFFRVNNEFKFSTFFWHKSGMPCSTRRSALFRKVCYFAKKQFKRTENFIQLSSVTSCGCAL